MSGPSPYFNPKPYIPALPSEIDDQLGSMILSAPTFKDRANQFPDWNIETEFDKLIESFDCVQKDWEKNVARGSSDLPAAKALFVVDHEDNGKTDQGCALLFEIEDVLSDVRRSRPKAQRPDNDSEITGG